MQVFYDKVKSTYKRKLLQDCFSFYKQEDTWMNTCRARVLVFWSHHLLLPAHFQFQSWTGYGTKNPLCLVLNRLSNQQGLHSPARKREELFYIFINIFILNRYVIKVPYNLVFTLFAHILYPFMAHCCSPIHATIHGFVSLYSILMANSSQISKQPFTP